MFMFQGATHLFNCHNDNLSLLEVQELIRTLHSFVLQLKRTGFCTENEKKGQIPRLYQKWMRLKAASACTCYQEAQCTVVLADSDPCVHPLTDSDQKGLDQRMRTKQRILG